MEQIIARNLTIGYNGIAVQENLNFAINAGDYLCIVGENGSGKSTLMKTMLGLIPPVAGEIAFAEGLSAKDIGYLPQQSSVQRDFPASVREIVLSGCLSRKGMISHYTKADKALASEAMEKMNITKLARRCYRELSGGQQQRVLLARALCAATSVLLLDEPVSGLDPNVTKDMYELISRINREDGITIIMITHDVEAAKAHASHILTIGGESDAR